MTAFTKSVAASADDGVELVGITYDNTESITGAAGVGNISDLTMHSGMRFNNVTIAQGSTIDSATITLYNQTSTLGGTFSARWYAWAADDAGQFVDAGNMPSTVTKTTAFASFTREGAGTPSTVAHTITSVIQEIINRAGWVSGNDINLIAFDNGSQTDTYDFFDSYDIGTPALLTVNYSAGGGSTSVAVFMNHLKTQGIS